MTWLNSVKKTKFLCQISCKRLVYKRELRKFEVCYTEDDLIEGQNVLLCFVSFMIKVIT